MSNAPGAAGGSIPCTLATFEGLSAEILRAGRALRFRAHGGSMWPLVRDGDVLLVQPVDPAAVRTGDVVLCGSGPGRVVVHRVVRIEDGPDSRRFTVQGDAVARPDGKFLPGQIYGRVVAIERGKTCIAMDRPAMRLLGRAAALRSAWNLGRGPRFQRARGLARRLPALSKFLA